MKGNGGWDVSKPPDSPQWSYMDSRIILRKSKKIYFFFIFSSSEADFVKDFLTKVLIEGTKIFFSKNWSVILKFCFLQIFIMVFAHSELKGFVHTTKIEKQVRFWNYLIFRAFEASQRAANIQQTKDSNLLLDLHEFFFKIVSLRLKKASKSFSNHRKRVTDRLYGVFWTMKTKRKHCIFNVILT